MAWTTNQTTAQMVTVLTAAGALPDQAKTALAGLAHKPGKVAVLWGVTAECTSGWNSGDPLFEYELAPAFTSTGQSLAQMVTALTARGANAYQATEFLHDTAWSPGKSVSFFGALVQCTNGWNSGPAPLYSYMIPA